MSQKNWYDDIQGAVDVTPPSGRGKFDFYRDIARAAGQGLSLGFGDEIEAAVTSFFGKRPYSEVVEEIRGDISQFKEQAPVVAYGAEILAFLVPVFVDLMMDNSQEDWGRPFYPVVD